jgi:muconolactone delta-isomerase
MQFIATLRRKTELFSEDDFAPHLAGEAERARTLYANGLVRQIWQRGDMPGACMLLETADEAEARSALGSLPLVEKGMLEICDLIALAPYRGFGPRG